MQLSGIVAGVKRWWWILLLGMILAGLAAAAVNARAPEQYEARTRLLIGPINTDNNTLRAAGQLARTYGELVTSHAVLESTSDSLGLGVPPETLAPAVRATADSATRMLIIRVRDTDPTRAAAIANQLGVQLAELTAQGTTRPEGIPTVIDPATSGEPVGTSAALLVVIAVLAGGLGALTVVLLVENLRESVGSELELGDVAATDVLGTVPPPGLQRASATELEEAPFSARAGAFRLLATKIDLSLDTGRAVSIAILPAGHGHSSGRLAANVALALAELGKRVALIDTDRFSSEATVLLGMTGRPGLGELMRLQVGERPTGIEPDVFLHPRAGIRVLPSGAAGAPTSVDGASADWLLGRLHESADIVVINAAAPEGSPATLMWARHADAVVVTANRGRTSRRDVASTVAALRLVEASVLGAILIRGRSLTSSAPASVGFALSQAAIRGRRNGSPGAAVPEAPSNRARR